MTVQLRTRYPYYYDPIDPDIDIITPRGLNVTDSQATAILAEYGAQVIGVYVYTGVDPPVLDPYALPVGTVIDGSTVITQEMLDAQLAGLGGGSAATTSFSPTGTLGSTNVQAAIVEASNEALAAAAAAQTTANTANTAAGTAATAAAAASTAAANALAATTLENVNAVATAGASQTLPAPATATIHRLALSATVCVLTFPAAAAGKSFTLELVQDATGSRTVTWPGTVRWAGGTAPTLTTTANKSDVFTFASFDGSTWRGFVAGQNF